jgi:hypothetical protein
MESDVATGIFDGSLTQIGLIVGTVAALGAAAQGLVDVTKGLWIKWDDSGYAFVKQALAPFDPILKSALGKGQSWQETLWAHWLNGRNRADQKAIAKSLIKLGLAPESVGMVSAIVKIDASAFATALRAIHAGKELTLEQVTLMEHFDAAIDARLDAAYERADRRYRSVAYNVAALIAVILAIFAGGLLFADACTAARAAAMNLSNNVCLPDQNLIAGYLGSRYFVLAILVGLIAIPVAPVSKDLASAISARARGIKAAKG